MYEHFMSNIYLELMLNYVNSGNLGMDLATEHLCAKIKFIIVFVVGGYKLSIYYQTFHCEVSPTPLPFTFCWVCLTLHMV